MDSLFGKGLSAYPSSWPRRGDSEDDIELGTYVEVASGPYADLQGVITYLEREYAWVRLDGDSYDLRFRREALRRSE